MRIHQTYGMKELCRIQVGENRSEFPRVGLGVELGQVSHLGQEERRPKWPFRLRVCKWEFRELPAASQRLLIMHTRFMNRSRSRVVLEPRCLSMSDEGFGVRSMARTPGWMQVSTRDAWSCDG